MGNIQRIICQQIPPTMCRPISLYFLTSVWLSTLTHFFSKTEAQSFPKTAWHRSRRCSNMSAYIHTYIVVNLQGIVFCNYLQRLDCVREIGQFTDFKTNSVNRKMAMSVLRFVTCFRDNLLKLNREDLSVSRWASYGVEWGTLWWPSETVIRSSF